MLRLFKPLVGIRPHLARRVHATAPRRAVAAAGADESPTGSLRPVADVIKDLSRRVPDAMLDNKVDGGMKMTFIPWYHANRILSHYCPGWSGEVRSVTYSTSSVTLVYRITIPSLEGDSWREATGTASTTGASGPNFDPVQIAESQAFRRAAARWGLGLYLYYDHEAKAPVA